MRHRWWIAGASLIGAAGLAIGARPPAPVPSPRFVAAHYMTQESPGAAVLPRDAALERWRGPGQVLGRLRAAERAFEGDPIGAARNDVRLGRAAGLDGFAILLSPGTMRHQFASAVDAIFVAAGETRDFRVAPDLWLDDAGDAAALDGLAVDLETLARRHDRAWRRVGGRRLVSLMPNPTRANDGLTPAALDRLFGRIGGRAAVYLVVYEAPRMAARSPLLLAAADAVTRWPTEPHRQALEADATARSVARVFGKPVVEAAMASFMQSRPHPGIVPNVREKLGLSTMIAQWRAAIARRAPAMMVATWNDRTEDSALLPEEGHGEAFLVVNRYLADWYRRGAPPRVARERAVLLHHPQLVGDAAARDRASFDWARRPPPTDYLMAVTMLARPAEVSLAIDGRVVARRMAPAGFWAWLVHTLPQGVSATDYPTAAEGIAATVVPAIPAGVPQLAVTRGDRRWRFASGRAIVQRGAVLDLTAHANLFDLDDGPRGAAD